MAARTISAVWRTSITAAACRLVRERVRFVQVVSLSGIAVMLILGGVPSAQAIPAADANSVLILDTTVIGGAASNEATQAAALGFTVEMATAEQWAAASTADFASYRALILGDPSCGSILSIAPAEANRVVWSPAVVGNIVVVGTDPTFHSFQGGEQVTNRGINFAASGETGLYLTLSCYYGFPSDVLVLDQFGAFSVTGGAGNDSHIVAEHPALDGLTDEDLNNWFFSVHEAFDTFPPNFIPLAIAQDIGPEGSRNFPDGSSGVPYILARGASPLFCGDGELDPNFEECDDGNTIPGDGCSQLCELELCGNDEIDDGEQCDDGNATSGDGCSQFCEFELCGDEEIDGGEQCDDGNTIGGDGCSATCQTEIDGVIVHPPVALLGWPEAFQFDGHGLAYIPLQEDGLDIHDVSDRDDSFQLSNYQPRDTECPGGFFFDEVFVEAHDSVAGASAGSCGVIGLDVSDPSNPDFLGRASISGAHAEEAATLDVGDDSFLYVASYSKGLQIYQVACDAGEGSCSLVLARGSIGAGDPAWGKALAVWIERVEGDGPDQILVYVATTEGLQIVDGTDPDNPLLLGRLDTNPSNLSLQDLDDVPQDVVVADGYAYVPIWIGGLIVVDVTDPANPLELQRIPAGEGSAFFKVEVSSQSNRIYVTEGIWGLAAFVQLEGQLELETRFAIGGGDERCNFNESGASDICWAWGVDESSELVGVGYGVFDSPLGGGYQLITQSPVAADGSPLDPLGATPVPEPHPLLLQAVGLLALAGLRRVRARNGRR